MGFFGERGLAAIKDGKPRSFTTFLGEMSFSHKTRGMVLSVWQLRALVSRRERLKTVSEGADLPMVSHPEP